MWYMVSDSYIFGWISNGIKQFLHVSECPYEGFECTLFNIVPLNLKDKVSFLNHSLTSCDSNVQQANLNSYLGGVPYQLVRQSHQAHAGPGWLMDRLFPKNVSSFIWNNDYTPNYYLFHPLAYHHAPNPKSKHSGS